MAVRARCHGLDGGNGAGVVLGTLTVGGGAGGAAGTATQAGGGGDGGGFTGNDPCSSEETDVGDTGGSGTGGTGGTGSPTYENGGNAGGGGGGGGFFGGGAGGDGAVVYFAAANSAFGGGAGGGGGSSYTGGAGVSGATINDAGNADSGAGQVNGGNGEAVFQYTDPISAGTPAPYADTVGQTLSVAKANGLLATASGPAGDTLTASAVGGTAQGGTVVVNSDGSFSYTPPSTTFTGTDTFSFTVTGASGDYATGTATVPVTGAPPVFTQDSPPLTAAAGTPYSYQFIASGTPSPTYSLGTGAPSWLTIDPTTGQVTGTPPAGTTSFSYPVLATNTAAPNGVAAGPFKVAVSDKADIQAALSCPSGLTVGKSATCTLTVTNAGPALAGHVVAGATVAPALRVTGCSGGCSRFGGVVGWTLGSLPAGQSDTLTISVMAARPGLALVTAADGSANPDPHPLNNLAAVTVKITR